MENNDVFDREEQLNQMRARTEETEKTRRSAQYLRKERDRKLDLFRSVLVCVTLGLLGLLFAMLYAHNYRYTTYSVDETYTITAPDTALVFPFGKGNVIVSGDAVTYAVKGKSVYTGAISVRDPHYAVEGNYFCLYGNGGYQAYICDTTGVLSTIRVSRAICGMDISAAGVVAVCTESEDTAYITYYDRFGTHISVDVKTALNLSGYPVHLTISPDGQKLAVIYYTVANGIGESRLVFYDFQKGRADKSYIIRAFEDFYDTDMFLVSCDFTDNRHVTVIGDKAFLFLSYNGSDTVTETTVAHKGTVLSAIQLGNVLLSVSDRGNGPVCTRYDLNGRVLSSFKAPESYENVTASSRYVLFTDGATIRFYNTSGKLRYEGSLPEKPVSVGFLGNRSLLINNGENLQKITLK